MASSRDSSVWKSLAVAFGDGLVFVAGMKLAQSTARPAPAAALPAAAPPPAAAPAPFDRKVLEAVVHAVDERLREHAEQVERRIADLEAKLALEVQSLDKKDEAVASAIVALREEVTRPGPSRELLMAIGQTCIDAAERGAGTPACRVETHLDPPPAPVRQAPG